MHHTKRATLQQVDIPAIQRRQQEPDWRMDCYTRVIFVDPFGRDLELVLEAEYILP